MRRFARCLSLLLALVSYETQALAASAPCVEPAGAAMAEMGMAEMVMAEMGMAETGTPDCGSHDCHRPDRDRPVPGCALAFACVAAALPVVAVPQPTSAASGHLAADTERSLIAGARPAPDVPPPRV